MASVQKKEKKVYNDSYFYKLIVDYNLNLMIEDVKVIKDVFDLFDIDENDQIDKNELKQAFEIVGSDARQDALDQILQKLQKSDSQTIDFKTFLIAMKDTISLKNCTREDAKKMFGYFLSGNTDETLNTVQLQKICQELNFDLNEKQIKNMIQKAAEDVNADTISFEQFYKYLFAQQQEQQDHKY